MLNKKALAASVSAPPAVFVEDVFSTFLYTGTGSTQTITNNIDLSGKGGLVWTKSRSNAGNFGLIDTVRGSDKIIYSDLTYVDTASDVITSFNSNGFTLGSDATLAVANTNAVTYASWTFREQAKFFDIVTYTGNGSNRTINHNLGSVPGSIWVKRTDTGSNWAVYHRSLANTEYLVLNTTAAKATGATRWNSTTPTSSVFSLGTDSTVNASGGTFVAYLFAHNAGGFGTSGSDNVISCGSFTTESAALDVNLGYEPQWLMIKRTDSAGDWQVYDNMRGMVSSGSRRLYPNSTDAEDAGAGIQLQATGFNINTTFNATFIYMAIRRPMKVPTTGTSVFAPVQKNFDGLVNSGFPTDLIFGTQLEGGNDWRWLDRLRGGNKTLSSNATSAEATENYWKFDNNSGVVLNIGSTFSTWFWYNFKRAPGFFDTVCYTGNSTSGTAGSQTINHNLGVAPEFGIFKSRNTTGVWVALFPDSVGDLGWANVNSTNASVSIGVPASAFLGNATTFTARTNGTPANANSENNRSGTNYVAHLFATLAGVSKCGRYSGTGTTQTINCGFTSGARMVLIKRTDSTGDWYIWNSARGIVSGNDPYLLLNDVSNAEVTNTDYVDADSSGFQISSTAPAAINANGGSFIFLAIA